jgi:hypothetical protein
MVQSAPAFLSVFQAGLTVPAVDTGWYDASGFHNPANGNYLAGDSTSTNTTQPLRNFFAFNLPDLAGGPIAAAVRVRTFAVSSPTGSEDYQMHEVTTPVATLRAGGSGLTGIFADLGDGPVFGGRTYRVSSNSNELVVLPLNPAAVAAIAAASGQGFAIGGQVTSLDATNRNGEFIFGSSTFSTNNVQLLLTLPANNIPPAVYLIPDQTITEDSTTGPIGFTVFDSETPASNLLVTASAADSVLLPAGGIELGGAGHQRTLTLTPAADRTGTTLVTVRVEDPHGGLTERQFLLTVTPVNDPPVAFSQSVATPEDTSLAIVLGASDPDNDPLGYSLTSPAHGVLTGVPPNLTYTPAANYSGPDSFTFMVNDGQVSSDTATVSINVMAQPDPPVANATATPTRVISPNNTNATVVLDGTRSSDADGDVLNYFWFLDGSASPLTPLPQDPRGMATATLAVGLRQVVLVVSDGARTDTNTVFVQVITACDAVSELSASVVAANLPGKAAEELLKELNRACDEFNRGHFDQGIDALRKFQDETRRRSGDEIDPALAQNFVNAAQAIIGALTFCDNVESIAVAVQQLGLEAKLERQLLKKLDDACREFDRAKPKNAVQKLKEFQKLVSMASGKRIAPAAAEALINAAQAVINSAQTPAAPRKKTPAPKKL